MKKQRRNMLTMMVFCLMLCFSTMGVSNNIKAAAKSDARIVDYDSGSRTERFHFGRNIGGVVNVTVIGDKESINVTQVAFKSSDSSVCSVTKSGDHYELKFLKEGISVITMTCKADGDSVEKRLLASCLTGISDAEGILKANSIVYRGCSDQEGISSKDTEIKARVSENKNITIDGVCGNYYKVWMEDEDFGDTSENWAYAKKQDVIIPLKAIVIPTEMEMYEDTEEMMNIQYVPSVAGIGEFSWQSSNTNVVKISGNGKLTAGKKGSAVVTVTSKSNPKITKKCRVRVKPYIPVTGIKIIPDKTETENGVLGKIEVEIIPSDASVQDFTWHVSSDEIMKVDPKGRYIGKKPGDVTITVTTVEGQFTDSCTIKVLPVSVSGVTLQKEAEIDVNEKYRLVWNTIPTNATNKEAEWTSDNESVVKVDEFGNITGVSLGSANIHVTTKEGNYKATCKVTVNKFVKDIRMTEAYYKLKAGKRKKLNIKVIPQDCTKKELMWRTDNQAAASVFQDGTIQTNRPGEAKITVYDRYTGAFAFALIDVTANLKKPKLKISGKNQKITLTWKRQKHATKYIVYEKIKGKKKFKKIAKIDRDKTKYVITNAKKQNQYKIKSYCKYSNEYSKYSNVKEVK